jgi:hypothetical protein
MQEIVSGNCNSIILNSYTIPFLFTTTLKSALIITQQLQNWKRSEGTRLVKKIPPQTDEFYLYVWNMAMRANG